MIYTSKKLRVVISIVILFTAIVLLSMDFRSLVYPEKLSEFGFFTGDIKMQQPAKGVVPYALATPLFSDYAEKLRFVKIPENRTARFNDTAVFEFPVGTALVKTFYYPLDFRNPQKGRRLMETRVLLHGEKGWVALPYVWNEEQSDAILSVAGETLNASYTDEKGKKRNHDYFVPNVNQCKGCHNRSEQLMPIGPSARQLNHSINYGELSVNQLEFWKSHDMISGLPDLKTLHTSVKWNDPSTGDITSRARIWLDINCAHCHRTDGPAATTGLYLGWNENSELHLGIEKTPVAAGRGSGGLKFGIVPGKPEESILLYRLKSQDPGVMMPELGRTQVHHESIAVLEEWIRKMQKTN